MALTDLQALEGKCQSIASTTEKLAIDLTQLQDHRPTLMSFRGIQPQESLILASPVSDAAEFVQCHHPEILLASMETALVAGGSWPSAMFEVRSKEQSFPIATIELIKSVERRVEDYKRKVTVQSEGCTNFFAKASSNKSDSESLGVLISSRENVTSREIGSTRQKLSKCNHELAEDQKQVSLARQMEQEAFKKEKHWKKVTLYAMTLKDIVGTLTTVEDT